MGILLLIFLKRIDERFPSVQEIDLIIEGSLVAGLLGTTFALVFGFEKLYALKSEDLNLTVIVGIVSEGLMSTGFGLAMSFSAWMVKKKLFPEEVKQRILFRKMQLQAEVLDSMSKEKDADKDKENKP